MQPITLTGSAAAAGVVLTCEHASPTVPDEYDGLGLAPELLADHIGWDIGAAALATELGSALALRPCSAPPRVCWSTATGDLGDTDLMPHESYGVDRARQRRHRCRGTGAAAGALLRSVPRRPSTRSSNSHPHALLLSVHSFTPELNGCTRPFDVGVLFDDFDDLAHASPGASAPPDFSGAHE